MLLLPVFLHVTMILWKNIDNVQCPHFLRNLPIDYKFVDFYFILYYNLYMEQRIKVRIGDENVRGKRNWKGYGKDVLYRLHSSTSTWKI